MRLIRREEGEEHREFVISPREQKEKSVPDIEGKDVVIEAPIYTLNEKED